MKRPIKMFWDHAPLRVRNTESPARWCVDDGARHCFTVFGSQQEANLFAYAPMMLEALEYVLLALDDCPGTGLGAGRREQIRKLVQRASGGGR